MILEEAFTDGEFDQLGGISQAQLIGQVGSMGLHRFIHTLEVFGTDKPVVPYSPDQVDARHEAGADAATDPKGVPVSA